MIDAALNSADPSWHATLNKAFSVMEPAYLHALQQDPTWLPGLTNLLRAFSLPLNQTRFILYGESPYPRRASANGYAFWDAAVSDIWAPGGLSKSINRATSLRNFIKMLLVAQNALSVKETGASAIAKLDKRVYCQTLAQLFQRFLDQGFLLLNASLVLSARPKVQEARLWLGFHDVILSALKAQQPELLLFGKIADQLDRLPSIASFTALRAEHPYKDKHLMINFI